MTETDGYNGFANYETWCVCLWMSNDRESYEHFRDLAQEIRARDARRPHCTEEEAASVALADALRVEFFENSDVLSACNVYADLLHAALSEVDWYELATTLLGELPQEKRHG